MKYVRQFLIILAFSFIGEVLKAVLPFPIPASIYGLILMLAALQIGIIPLESVRETGRFLIEIMPLMFVPAAVGLTQSWDKVRPILVPLLVTTVVSTVAVMVAAGKVTQMVQRKNK